MYRQTVEPIIMGIFNHVGLLSPHPGRLTCTLTGAGKRRLIAIGNYVRQRLLHPVHDWAMRVLSRIPNDVSIKKVPSTVLAVFALQMLCLSTFHLRQIGGLW